jgi:hypothetical protein
MSLRRPSVTRNIKAKIVSTGVRVIDGRGTNGDRIERDLGQM